MRTVGLKRACKIFWLICRVRDLAPGGPFMPPLRPQAGASHSGSHEKCDNFCSFFIPGGVPIRKKFNSAVLQAVAKRGRRFAPFNFCPPPPDSTASKFRVACIA